MHAFAAVTVLGPALSLDAARAVSGWAVLVQHSDRGTLRLRAPPLLRALVSSAAWVCGPASAAAQACPHYRHRNDTTHLRSATTIHRLRQTATIPKFDHKSVSTTAQPCCRAPLIDG